MSDEPPPNLSTDIVDALNEATAERLRDVARYARALAEDKKREGQAVIGPWPDVCFSTMNSVADDTPQSVNGINSPDTPQCEWTTTRGPAINKFSVAEVLTQ